jgi:hypothetical protein
MAKSQGMKIARNVHMPKYTLDIAEGRRKWEPGPHPDQRVCRCGRPAPCAVGLERFLRAQERPSHWWVRIGRRG